MAMTIDFVVNITYQQIGTHMLIHFYHRKIINDWMLLDLEELASISGKRIDEIIEKMTRRNEVCLWQE